MKLAGAQASAFIAKPDAGRAAVLLYGMDAMRVSLKRQQLIKALVGPKAEEEMRLERLNGADLRKEPALVLDGLKAQGFFPGPRVVFVEGAGDGLADVMTTALREWSKGDATLVVTAGSLNARSKLRKAFEGDGKSVAIGIYDDPPARADIERMAAEANLPALSKSNMDDLLTLARTLDPGELSQTIEKLGLYKFRDDTPISGDDIDACMPATSDANLDDAAHAIAEGRAGEVVPTLKRLAGQGINPTALCIAATRHFRSLHAAATHPQGPDAALSRARPPVFGPRKDRLVRQAQRLGAAHLEKALTELMNTDLALRSAKKAPEMALVERAFIRIAMLKRS
ncbi:MULTISPECIES: DNA polymerase III subunit delta [Rhodobacterales]|uniref:DNA polymerase III subunit delta n=1 Tax=Roseobacter sp. N2S TaxID=2663844 RepID=UPI00285D71FF|nr:MULTISPECIES: DNA polymerase III subunit delta [Rhodobacterales]MDR6263156.1 DNA polymerase-3 subunit delta [Roseobacter sp. N2S]